MPFARGIGPLELLLLMPFVIAYFIPCIIALTRKHHHAVPIIIINIFLGWTLFVWVVCVAWSFMPVKQKVSGNR